MIQSLSRSKEIEKISGRFGTIIVDECHHIPAKTYRDTIGKLSTYYLYGLTATPFIRYKLPSYIECPLINFLQTESEKIIYINYRYFPKISIHIIYTD